MTALNLRRRLERLERIADQKAPQRTALTTGTAILRAWDFGTTEEFGAAIDAVELPDDWRPEFDAPALIVMRLPGDMIEELRAGTWQPGVARHHLTDGPKRTVTHHIGGALWTGTEAEWQEVLAQEN